ncbi:DUF389 domain-containing protein [Mumia zhuanghuii]|uniref:DUF389 domain-containing protein n=2 Tax=Mumia TaxID=1546255 RepID=A0ABW1QIM0_9ACTN|nr:MULTISPECIES: DUF389 domain-containing protein [Mumia]KAA1424783.1 DUF389 domain-containing protein [Mumia zhuanghuii]
MLHLRLVVPASLTDAVEDLLLADDAVSSVVVLRGVALKPTGDLVHADVAREAANEVVQALRALGVHRQGTLHIDPVQTWLSQAAFDAEQKAPGSSADSIVWAGVAQQAYEDTEANWTFMSFMVLATVLASIALAIDSLVLVIGAMILGPEFGAVIALGVALVRKRYHLLRRAVRTLALGFGGAILVTTLLALAARALGWITPAMLSAPHPQTAFVSAPDQWSFVVAVIAASAGVLSVTSSRVGGLSGVFISVTTIPAAGDIAIGLAFGQWSDVRGSGLQLLANLTGMALAGWLTLLLQQTLWSRISRQRARLLGRLAR